MDNCRISIIVPAYNEEARIPYFLPRLLRYAESNLVNYEIIIVNDGSEDKTYQVVKDIINNYDTAYLISYENNMGKGHAVLQGVLHSNGDFILFIDADGSIPPYEIKRMYEIYKKTNNQIIIGSRISALSEIEKSQPLIRRLLSKVFNLFSDLLFQLKIKDLLCGFKGFSRDSEINIFKNMKSYGWEFDVDVLIKKKRENYKIYKLPIKWEHKEGSKISTLDPLFILLNLIVLRLRFI